MSEFVQPGDLFSPLVEHAIELSAQWHEGTYRKGAWREAAFEAPGDTDVQVPVMAHLAAVASIVQRAGWGDEVVAAAYLHDVIEDRNQHGQRLRRQQLREAVGASVTRLVDQVSEQKLESNGTPRSWQARKDAYVEGLRTALPQAVAISLADKLHNLWSMNQSLEAGEDIFTSAPGRTALSAGPEAQHRFYRAVLDASDVHDDPRLDPMRIALESELERFETLVADVLDVDVVDV